MYSTHVRMLLSKGGELTSLLCNNCSYNWEMVDISEEDSSLAENIPLIHIYHIKHIHIRHVTVSGWRWAFSIHIWGLETSFSGRGEIIKCELVSATEVHLRPLSETNAIVDFSPAASRSNSLQKVHFCRVTFVKRTWVNPFLLFFPPIDKA